MITRHIVTSDVNYLRNSFCRGVLQTPSCTDVSWKFMRDMIDRVIVDDYWTTLAYVDEQVEDEIVSWASFNSRDRKVFWLSTKPRFFKQGLGWALLQSAMAPGKILFPFAMFPWQVAVARRMGYTIEVRPFIALE